MKSTYRSFLPVLAVIIAMGICCKNKPGKAQDKIEKQLSTLQENIGEKFEAGTVIDSSGKQVSLDFSKSAYTIIDFWFSECPPCIQEMKQFENLIRGKDENIRIISISINRFTLWKNTLKGSPATFAFLSNSLPNWEHYTLKSSIDEKLKNDINSDSANELIKRFNVAFYPAYFVVDRNGIIQSRPGSAVEFIKKLDM